MRSPKPPVRVYEMRTLLNRSEQRFNGSGFVELPNFPGYGPGTHGMARQRKGTILPRYGCDYGNGQTEECAGTR